MSVAPWIYWLVLIICIVVLAVQSQRDFAKKFKKDRAEKMITQKLLSGKREV